MAVYYTNHQNCLYNNYVYGRGDTNKLLYKISGIVLHNIIDVVSVGALFADLCKESATAEEKKRNQKGHALTA